MDMSGAPATADNRSIEGHRAGQKDIKRIAEDLCRKICGRARTEAPFARFVRVAARAGSALLPLGNEFVRVARLQIILA